MKKGKTIHLSTANVGGNKEELWKTLLKNEAHALTFEKEFLEKKKFAISL
ncbi:hypothetical protein [Alteribacillus iranensis]|nr:hypothetical protein [Alteribacillus iranensis]